MKTTNAKRPPLHALPRLMYHIDRDEMALGSAAYNAEKAELRVVLAGVCPEGSAARNLFHALSDWLELILLTAESQEVTALHLDFSGFHYTWGDGMLGIMQQLGNYKRQGLRPGRTAGEVADFCSEAQRITL